MLTRIRKYTLCICACLWTMLCTNQILFGFCLAPEFHCQDAHNSFQEQLSLSQREQCYLLGCEGADVILQHHQMVLQEWNSIHLIWTYIDCAILICTYINQAILICTYVALVCLAEHHCSRLPSAAGRLNNAMGCCACRYVSTLFCLKTHTEELLTLYTCALNIYKQNRMI